MRPVLPPLALYVHFPWCVRRCPYCDFNAHQLTGDLPEQRYIDRLIEDLEQDVDWARGRPVESIFLGGGTPSLFTPQALDRLMTALRKRLDFAPKAEITLEANPGALDREYFAGYREAGINRLSLGVQSFAERQLVALGRIHGAADARRAASAARAAGFARINLDLMHGLPGQTPAGALADIDTALDAGADHISWYQLTIEPGTPFARRAPELPDEATLDAIEHAGLERLAAAGLHRYEISAFARRGEEAAHNLNYWRYGDYLGIGAGAHGKSTDAGTGVVLRSRKPAQPGRYLATPAGELRESWRVGPRELPGEFMLNALRLLDGVERACFTERTGLPFSTIAAKVEELIARGLLHRERLALTPRGRRYLDSVVAEFL